MRIWCMLLMAFGAYSFAASETQDDWSGGGGQPGPVLEWGSEFSEQTDINWEGVPGRLSLPLDSVAKHLIGAAPSSCRGICAEDVDADEDIDVVISSVGDGELVWLENTDGYGSDWVKHIIGNSTSPRRIHVADIDGDNDLDVACADQQEGIFWWANDDGSGTSWTQHTVYEADPGASDVHVDDLDSDGDQDIAATLTSYDEVAWWENQNGWGTSWIKHSVDDNFSGPWSVHVADINGDGWPDVIGSGRTSGDPEFAWWSNEDSLGTSWSKFTLDDTYQKPSVVTSSDIDNDGDEDIIGAAFGEYPEYKSAYICWMNDDGAGSSWTQQIIEDLSGIGGAYCVYPIDANSDGDIDILAGAYLLENEIALFENCNASGTEWSKHVIDGDLGPMALSANDIDNDGDADLLGTRSSQTAWYDLRYFTEGHLISSILDTQAAPDWEEIDWSGTEPQGTAIGFQLRSSDNPGVMGEWSDTLYSPGDLDGVIGDQEALVQYRAILSTDNSSVTPILEDITIGWIPVTGIRHDVDAIQHDCGLLVYGQNPAYNELTVRFELYTSSKVSFEIYDAMGRLAGQRSGDYQVGLNQETFSELDTGVYFVLISADQHSQMRRYVYLEK